MKDNVYLYNKDKYVGILTYDSDKSEYSFKQEGFGELENLTMDYMALNSCSMGIECAISERVMPRNRINVNELLRMLGLDYYDMWEIFKKINGICYKDTVWISEEKIDGSWFFENHALGRFIKTGSYF